MLVKELFESLRTLSHCLLLLLFIPVAKVMHWEMYHAQWDVAGLYQPFFAGIIIIYAAYSGVSIFRRERKDRAIEYLLTLPVSIHRIVGRKILARFILLTVLFLVGLGFGVFKDPPADAAGITIMFLFAVFISLAVDSLFNAMIGVLLLNIIYYYSSLIISYFPLKNQWFGVDTPVLWFSMLIPALVMLAPLALAFHLTLKNFDARPLKWQARAYLKVALPVMALMLTFIILFFKQYFFWVQTIE